MSWSMSRSCSGTTRKALGNFSPRDSKRLSTRHDPWQTGHGMSWLTRHNTRVLHSGATSGAGRSMLRSRKSTWRVAAHLRRASEDTWFAGTSARTSSQRPRWESPTNTRRSHAAMSPSTKVSGTPTRAHPRGDATACPTRSPSHRLSEPCDEGAAPAKTTERNRPERSTRTRCRQSIECSRRRACRRPCLPQAL